ncbi:MAG: hypothetical protein ACQPRH_01475 [Solitalea-like symbiont of Tyrophagus putrescentiae]
MNKIINIRLFKAMVVATVIVATTYLMQSCCIMGCYPVINKIVAADQKLTVQHNYIAIMAKDGSEVDIEVSYYVLDNDTNKTIVKKLKTPCIIGGEDVMILYDVHELTKNNQHLSYFCELKTDSVYTQAGDLTIKNLSDKTLEYAFINNVDIMFLTKENVLSYGIKNVEIIKDLTKVFNRHYNSRVGPVYKWAPILYLIKPELAPKALCYVINAPDGGFITKTAKEIPLKEPHFGEITTSKPYSIEQIIEIYRDKQNELFENYENQYLEKSTANDCRIKLFYGTIKENGSYTNADTMMWINVDTFRGHNDCLQ